MKRKSLQYIILTALLAALVTVFTAFIGHIPLPGNEGFLHFGDALIYLAGCLLPTPYAVAVGAVGGGLADLLSTCPQYTIPTLVIKACVALCFSAKRKKMLRPRNVLALLPAAAVTVIGYYFAQLILFRGTDWRVILVPSVTASLIQAAGSSALFAALAAWFDKIGLKKRLG